MKNKFRKMLLLTVALMVLTVCFCFSAAAVDEIPEPSGAVTQSGQCGENVTYALYENGVLVISGSGDMYDYDYWDEGEGPCSDFYGMDFSYAIIEEGVTSVGDEVFSRCQSLQGVVIPKSVTSIGSDAFSYCSALKSLNIPDGVTSIGAYSFLYCSNLESITIPDSVTSIGNSAFYRCTSLESITIPDSVTTISYGAFYGCENISRVDVADINSWLGISFENESANPLYYGAELYINGEKPVDLTVPNGITTIPDYAFSRCTTLESIEIPESVTSIGESAFYGCENISRVDVADINSWLGISFKNETANPLYYGAELYINGEKPVDLTVPNGITTIPDYAFSRCTTLESIEIPESVTSIGSGAFSGCTSLESINIPEGVTSIGDRTFIRCESLQTIVLPEGIKTIGRNAFYGCSGLVSINIPESVTSIGGEGDYIVSEAFAGCYSLEKVYITDIRCWLDISFHYSANNPLNNGADLYLNGKKVVDLVIPQGVTSIGGYAFDGCTSVESIVIPEGVTSIGYYAFSECTSLESINIPKGFTSIGGGAFSRCTSLESINIPKGVTSIGESAFSGCTSLESIEIPEGVTGLGYYTFYGCTSLESIVIPESVTSISSSALDGCSNLKSVYITSLEKWYNISFDNSWSKFSLNGADLYINGEKLTEVTFPDGTSEVGRTFIGCGSIKKIIIPEGVTSISDAAFSGCTGLESIVIPESVTSIGNNAFSGCTSLESINIPKGVTSLEYGTFSGCTSLESIVIPENVTSIGGGAFYKCTSLESIVLPEGITSISDNTFSGCTSLESIVIPENVTSIGDDAFYGCTSLESIVIPENVTSIGDDAFSECTSLESINIPEGVISIGDDAFYGCTSLESINIPEGVTSIGDDAFYGCTSLESITIPKSLTKIGGWSFNNCGQLKSVYITSLESWCNIAFENGNSNPLCNGADLYLNGNKIVDLVIPETVTSIGKYAFYGCRSIKSVTISEGVTSIVNSVFRECEKLRRIDIPDSVISIEYLPYDIVIYCNLFSYAFDYAEENGLKYVVMDATDEDSIVSGSYGDSMTWTLDKRTGVLLLEGEIKEINRNVTSAWDNYKYCITDIVFCDGIEKIGDNAFYGFYRLETIALPETVTSIGRYAFDNCKALASISMPGMLSSFGYGAFWGCIALESFVVPEGITEIASYLFCGCKNLENVVLHENITTIGSNAFSDCASLKEIEIPDSVTTISREVFKNCSSLEKIVLPSTVEIIGNNAFYGCVKLAEIELPAGLVEIDYEAFRGCESLTAVKLPGSINSLGDRIFADCPALKEVIIEEGVKSLSAGMFTNCTSLESIKLPLSLTSFDGSAFIGCSSLKEIAVDENSQYFSVDEQGVLFNKDKTKLLLYPAGKSGNYYEIPESVTTIGAYAFHGCKELENIVIPENVTSIGSYAFQNCIRLKDVKIPEKVYDIGSYAFCNCDSLESIKLPDSVVYLYNGAFDGCDNLKNVILSKNIETIYSYAFYDCDKLENVILPENLVTIKEYVFRYCDALESIVIPKNVTKIGRDAFCACRNLKEITFHNKIAEIEYYAFESTNLTDIYFAGTQQEWNAVSIGSDNMPLMEATVHYGVEPHEHEIVSEVTTPANCMQQGEITYSCDCGFTYRETLWAMDHNYELSVITPATCEQDGEGLMECVCGLSYSSTIEKLGHRHQDIFTVDVAPTCTKPGYKSKHCTRPECDSKISSTTIPATGHKFDKEIIADEASYTSTGLKIYICSACEAEKEETLKKLELPKVEGFGVKSVTTNSITLKWDKVEEAKAYRVYQKTSTGWKKVCDIAATELTVKNLSPGTKYTFAIRSGLKEEGQAVLNPGYTEITTATQPPMPIINKVEQNATTIRLTWNPCKGAHGYRVYQWKSDKWVNIGTITGTVATIKNLKNGTTYKFTVRAYIKTESGVVWSDYVGKSASTAPAAPTVKLASTQKGTLNVIWTKVSGAQYYELYYKVGNGGYRLNKTIFKSAQSLTFKNLPSGTKYTVAVRAYRIVDGKKIYSSYLPVVKTIK